MQQLLIHLESSRRPCQRHRVRQLRGFGLLLTPAFRADSDMDLVAEFEPMPPEDYAGTRRRFSALCAAGSSADSHENIIVHPPGEDVNPLDGSKADEVELLRIPNLILLAMPQDARPARV